MRGLMKKHVMLLLSLAVMLMIGTSLQAKDKVVVIPLSVSKSMNNIVTVAKSGGDFTDLQAAIDSITDADRYNPYLIVIAPGWYEIKQTITMKNYVSITGSGQEATFLSGNIGGDSRKNSAIIQGASVAELSNISIYNGGPESTPTEFAVGLYAKNTSLSLKNVKLDVNAGVGAHYTRAVYNLGNGYFKLDNVILYGYGKDAAAFWNDDTATVHLSNAQLLASGNNSMAFLNGGTATAHLSNTELTAIGEFSKAFLNGDNATAHLSNTELTTIGDNSTAFFNDINGIAYLTHVTADARGPGSRGLMNSATCESHVNGSTLSGYYFGVVISSPKTRISNTLIKGGVYNDPSPQNCRNTYDSDFQDVNC